MSVSDHILQVTEAGGGTVAIEFRDQALTWADLRRGIDRLDARLCERRLGRDAPVALLGRNGIEQLAAFIAVLGSGRVLVLVNALRPPGLIAEEVAALDVGCLIGAADDFGLEILAASRQAGTMALAASVNGDGLQLEEVTPLADKSFRAREGGTLIEIQTSGTTGAPKRIAVAESTVMASMKDGVRSAMGAVEQTKLKPKSSPTLMFSPLVHTSGTFNTLMSVFEVRPIVLFERFEPDTYRAALVRYRPKFAPLPPTAIKMMVDSPATREDFASVRAVRAGTAPLPVELQVAFEDKFGVPVLTTYGATEFMGAIASWTLDDHQRFATSKRGSVGRPSKGVRIRIVDPDTGVEAPVGAPGVLQAKVDRIDGGANWIGTTDLARFDEDGFIYILGRLDDAIIRGGFKVMAGKVADVLRGFPGVYDAIVVGRQDARLGEAPVAVVEPYPAASELTAETLRAYAKTRLAPYETPVRIHVVDRLPRTVSDKISRPEVNKLLDRLEP